MTNALDSVDLSIVPGEVHALVGQNGSGKSTLIKILSGYHYPDHGSVSINGTPVRLPLDAGEANRLGLSFMHQDLALADGMTVLENLRIGRYETNWYGRLLWRRERERVRTLLADVGLAIDPDLPVRRLPPAERALVGFARALQHIGKGPGVLVLDEPTAYLPLPAVKRLFTAIRALTSSGSGVLFVSHRLDEVMEISDRVSVLRNGRLEGTKQREEVDRQTLVSMILGRDLGRLYPEAAPHEVQGEPRLTVSELSGSSVASVEFGLWPGEILGLTGLVGMGHDEVPYLIYGAQQARSGLIAAGGRKIMAAAASPEVLRAFGIALLPADRQRQSGVGAATLRENLTLPNVADYFTSGVLHHARERSDVAALLDSFRVQPAEPDRPLSTLSGGNQQKVLLAKWLHTKPSVLLLHEPTQGVDIGSRKEIFRIIREVASSGVAVLIASSEYEDLANMCDRVLVMHMGRIAQELHGEGLTEDRIIEQCYLAG